MTMAKVELNSSVAIYTNDAKNVVANSAQRKLVVSTHGGWSEGDGTFQPRTEFGVVISFYSNENYCVTGDIEDALSGSIQTIDSPAVSVKNYELTRFEHDPNKKGINPHLTNRCDALKVRTKWFGERKVRLKTVLQTLQSKGYQYKEICCLFCRFTGMDATQDARQRTQAESERLDHLAKSNAIAQELKGRFGS
jgi:hypothetical protein